MKKLFLIFSLLISTVTPSLIAISREQIVTKLTEYKNELNKNFNEFMQCIKRDKACDPEKRNKIYIGIAAIVAGIVIVTAGVGVYYFVKKKRVLLNAILADDVQKLKELMEVGVDVTKPTLSDPLSPESLTPLMLAALKGRIRIVEVLIGEGNVDVNTKQDRSSMTALMWAVYPSSNFEPEVIKKLIAAGANINEQDLYGRTALIWAVTSNDVKRVKFLLDIGADITIRDYNNKDALAWAMWSTNPEMIDFLRQYLPSEPLPEQFKNYYAILGLSKDATINQIRKAYKKFALKWHPDKNSSPEAPEKFKEIGEAYEVLSDPDKRRQFDQEWR